MRYASLLPPLIIALTVAACARQQPAYYVTDSRTGQRIATGQQATSDSRRGLLGAGEAQASGYNSYASATPQRQESSGRGLFNSHVFGSSEFRTSSFSRQSPAPTYAVQPQASQTYGSQTYASRTYAPQSYSYRPPQQQAYVQQPATTQYRRPQPAPQQYTRQPYTQRQYYRQPQPTGYYPTRYGVY